MDIKSGGGYRLLPTVSICTTLCAPTNERAQKFNQWVIIAESPYAVNQQQS